MVFDSLQPDHWVFWAIDAFIGVLLFPLFVKLLRASVRFLGGRGADDDPRKCVTGLLLVLLFSVVATKLVLSLSIVDRALQVPAIASRITPPELLPYLFLSFCLLLGPAVLLSSCVVPLRRGLLITMILAALGFGTCRGLTMVANIVLPEDRISLGGKSTAWFLKSSEDSDDSGTTNKVVETANAVKSGLTVEAQAVASAVALLKDPHAIEKMTEEHNADLRELGLLAEPGERIRFSEEELADLGIVGDKEGGGGVLCMGSTNDIRDNSAVGKVMSFFGSSKGGSNAPSTAAAGNFASLWKSVGKEGPAKDTNDTAHKASGAGDVASLLKSTDKGGPQEGSQGAPHKPADIGDVASLLKSVRPDEKTPGPEGSGGANDVIFVGKDAVNLFPGCEEQIAKEKQLAALKATGLSVSSQALVSLKPLSIAPTTSSGVVAQTRAASRAPEAVGGGLGTATQKVEVVDPLLALAPSDRAAWKLSQTGLVATGVMSIGGDRGSAVVNGKLVRVGTVVTVLSEGRSFAWLLAGFTGRGVIWTPILDVSDERALDSLQL